jgi:hypothetical protein
MTAPPERPKSDADLHIPLVRLRRKIALLREREAVKAGARPVPILALLRLRRRGSR